MMTKLDHPQPAKSASDEEPQVYAVRRDRQGITFSRRDFLVVATAAVAATGLSGCGEAAPASTPTALPTATLTPMPTLSPQQASEACKNIKAHRAGVEALAISLDGKLLVSGGGPYDRAIKVWSLPDGALQTTLTGHKGTVIALAISPDGKLLAFESNNDVKLWAPPDRAPRATLTGHTSSVSTLAISPDGKLLASGSGDGTIRLWTLPDGNAVGCLLDLAALTGEIKGATYEAKDASGKAATYTLPCGSAIPTGAVCTCNCVGLTGSCSCVGHLSSGTHYWYPN